MPNRLTRREPQGWGADTRHVLFMATLFLLVLFSAEPAQKLAFRHAYIDLQSVTVPDHRLGDDPDITVYRTIAQDFTGSFSVLVRRQDHTVACATRWPEAFTYRAAAARANPIRMSLRQWIGREDQLDACIARGTFGAGRYYLETCHRALVLGVFPARRCVASNIFTRS